MKQFSNSIGMRLTSFLAGLTLPSVVSAQQMHEAAVQGSSGMGFAFMSFALFLAVSLVLSRLWIGIVNLSFAHEQKISSLEADQPYLPSAKVIAGTFFGTALLFALSLHSGLHQLIAFDRQNSALALGLIFMVIGAMCLALEQRFWVARAYVFSGIVGCSLALVLVGMDRMLFSGAMPHDPYFMSLAFLAVAIAWRLLFGPWEPHIKATVLGSFIVCVSGYMLWNDPAQVRTARLLATVVALIPALIWCSFFLKYHRQRQSMVLLMFFAGMLSTAPILFYDRLVRSQSELQFFYFRLVPESFNQTASTFVTSNLTGITGVRSTLLVTLLSFVFVAMIEEFSKFWVMKKSGRDFFSSIDDALQLSIIVAIGFAFAENVLNPTYFMSFVRDFVMGSSPQWGAFIGNVMGRSILTNMVHIVSTGVLGYFFGMALFAGPYLREMHSKGKFFWVSDGLHSLLGLPAKLVFRRQMFLTGLLIAIVLHGAFNFLVTFPDILPNRPRTVGDLLGTSNGVLGSLPLLMIPSLFYVVGGCWLLTELFYRKENMKEHGHVVTTDTFVKESKVA